MGERTRIARPDVRMVAIAYRFGAIYIKFVGTHAEYEKIDANTVEME